MGVAHFTLDLRPRDEGGDRVDHDHIDGVGSHEKFADLQCLLTGVGLTDQHLVDVDPELLGPRRIERMFRIDERCDATALLGVRRHGQGEGRLTGGLRPEDLDHASLGQTTSTEGEIETQRAGRRAGDTRQMVAVELHDRALAVGLLDLAEGPIERLLPAGVDRLLVRSSARRGFLGRGLLHRGPPLRRLRVVLGFQRRLGHVVLAFHCRVRGVSCAILRGSAAGIPAR